jgi:aspartate/methionine/tyrosine aminotransferase
LHLVTDELYSLSIHGVGAPPFVSLGHRPLDDREHVIWGLSKDFAMSGLRVGVVDTGSDAVRDAMRAAAFWASISTHTQAVLSAVLEDDSWIDEFITINRMRLAESYRITSTALERAGVPHQSSDAGFFTMVDLRSQLAEPTWEGEAELWRRMIDDFNVNLTPGSACRTAEPGWFRLCFAAVPADVLAVGMGRIAALVSGS